MIWDKVKAAALWVWNWVTVLATIVFGMLSVTLDYLEQLSGVDLTQIMTERRAAQIAFWTAITKATVATYTAMKGSKDA